MACEEVVFVFLTLQGLLLDPWYRYSHERRDASHYTKLRELGARMLLPQRLDYWPCLVVRTIMPPLRLLVLQAPSSSSPKKGISFFSPQPIFIPLKSE
ncbi:hypothetical protein BKA63DRAFT_501119 [Paraphoma chrysanthemicola]|nr:hypothetical protein BKA63DRAFT_501119 [Paraphoma chrysanthemicola]